jgi:hypothetical protein
MPAALQPRQRHERYQIADVKARGGRIETAVDGDPLFRDRL